MIEFTDASFPEVLAKGEPVIIDFGAQWCGPCQMMLPIVEELAAEYEGKIIVGKMNVDDNDAVPSQYGIMNIPCMLFFKNGELVERHVGACSKEELKKHFAALIGEAVEEAPAAEKKGLFGKLFGK